jgi:5-methylcytosine-specific restriction protein A
VAVATERDHIVPLWAGGLDVESNVQALCVDCHKIKTAAESRVRYRGSR